MSFKHTSSEGAHAVNLRPSSRQLNKYAPAARGSGGSRGFIKLQDARHQKFLQRFGLSGRQRLKFQTHVIVAYETDHAGAAAHDPVVAPEVEIELDARAYRKPGFALHEHAAGAQVHGHA